MNNATRQIGGLTIAPVAADATPNSLTIGASGSLSIGGVVQNDGVISVGNSITPRGNLEFRGGGHVTLGRPFYSNSRIDGFDSVGRMTNGFGHTIEGQGSIAGGRLGIENRGEIRATGGVLAVSATARDVPLGSPDIVNSGILRASSVPSTPPATLRLSSGSYANANGLIEADGSNATVELNGDIDIHGGTIRGVNGGAIQASGIIRLTDLATAGSLRLNQYAALVLDGTIVNDGVITSQLSGYHPVVQAAPGGATLEGSGRLSITGTYPTRSTADLPAAGLLVNGDAHRIDGYGTYTTPGLSNLGTIASTSKMQPFVLNLTAGGLDASGLGDVVDNRGTIRADAGTLLQIAGTGSLRNRNLIVADGANAIVELQGGASIHGGTIRGSNFGIIRGGQSPATLYGVTLDGAIDLKGIALGGGTFANAGQGVVTLGATTVIGDVTFDGPGILRLGVQTHEFGAIGARSSLERPSLTNGASHTIVGSGSLGGSNGDFVYPIKLINHGTISTGDRFHAPLIIRPGTESFTNYGELRASGSSARLILDRGMHRMMSGSVLSVDAGTSLTLELFATLRLEAGSTFIQNGQFTMYGTFENAGEYSPGGAGSALKQQVGIAFRNETAGTLVMDVGGTTAGTQHDQLRVSQPIELDGELDLRLAGGFEPSLYGVPIVLIDGDTASDVVGTFRHVTNVGTASDRRLAVIYGPNPDAPIDVSLVAAVPGDTDVNGRVDFDDLLALATAYGTTAGPTYWQAGDFDGSGTTTFDDLLSLATNYGFGTPSAAAPSIHQLATLDSAFAADWALAQSIVPEPAVGAALVTFILSLGRTRHASKRRLTSFKPRPTGAGGPRHQSA